MNLNKNKGVRVCHGIKAELGGLAGNHYVYFLIRGSRIVYIGYSSNIQQRISNHKSGLWIKNWFTSVRFIQCENSLIALRYEKRLIELFKPKYNGIKRPAGGNLSYEEWHRMRKIYNERIVARV